MECLVHLNEPYKVFSAPTPIMFPHSLQIPVESQVPNNVTLLAAGSKFRADPKQCPERTVMMSPTRPILVLATVSKYVNFSSTILLVLSWLEILNCLFEDGEEYTPAVLDREDVGRSINVYVIIDATFILLVGKVDKETSLSIMDAL